MTPEEIDKELHHRYRRLKIISGAMLAHQHVGEIAEQKKRIAELKKMAGYTKCNTNLHCYR